MAREERGRCLRRALACGFALAVLCRVFPGAAATAQVPGEVLRLRVVAHSDSREEQELKLKVRDGVLEEAAKWCQGAESLEEANAALCTHLQSIGKAAQAVLAREGSGHGCRVQVTDAYFPTKEYQGFTLPAGVYRTLQVTLGDGAGRNWWCVVFPALCLPGAQEDHSVLDLLPQGERQVVEKAEDYQVSFKVVELYQELRQWLRGLG